MNNLEIYTELQCRYLINFLFISVRNEGSYLKINEYYKGLLRSENYDNNYSELLMLIKPFNFPSETTDYLLNKEDYEDIFFEYFNVKKVEVDYFDRLNSVINRVFISMNLKDVDLLLNEAENYLFVFDSKIIGEIKKLNLNFKKINLLNLLNLEFNYQISYFLHSKRNLSNCDCFFNGIKECLVNNCFLIREILKNNEFSIFNISLNSVNQTKNATSANKSKTMGANEVIEFFKDFLLQRNIIDSKKILIDLSTQAVTKTINFYQKKYDINLERKFIKKALNRWIANEFQNFAKSKGIKVNNKVIPFIYYLKSNI